MAKKTSKNTPPAASEGKITLADLKGPLASMGGMFTPNAEALPEGTEFRAMSPMLKPTDFPPGQYIRGVFTKMFTTNPTADKQGVGIEIVPIGKTSGIALPAVATIRTGLSIKGGEVKGGDEPTSPFLGREVAIRLSDVPKIPSKKGQDAWNFLVAILPKRAN